MNVVDKNLVLISGAVIFRDKNGPLRWFLVKNSEEEGWEIPKVVARKGESSVRAALRMMGEKGGMTTRVIEEAYRAGGAATINGKTLPQRHLYYFMIFKGGLEEPIGFHESAWMEYGPAVRKLSTKRERLALRKAREEYNKWKKARKKRRQQLKELKA